MRRWLLSSSAALLLLVVTRLLAAAPHRFNSSAALPLLVVTQLLAAMPHRSGGGLCPRRQLQASWSGLCQLLAPRGLRVNLSRTGALRPPEFRIHHHLCLSFQHYRLESCQKIGPPKPNGWLFREAGLWVLHRELQLLRELQQDGMVSPPQVVAFLRRWTWTLAHHDVLSMEWAGPLPQSHRQLRRPCLHATLARGLTRLLQQQDLASQPRSIGHSRHMTLSRRLFLRGSTATKLLIMIPEVERMVCVARTMDRTSRFRLGGRGLMVRLRLPRMCSKRYRGRSELMRQICDLRLARSLRVRRDQHVPQRLLAPFRPQV